MGKFSDSPQSEHPLPRYVILFHEVNPHTMPGRQDHWDLMLESEGKLLTWELESAPSVNQKCSARKIQDHRMEYLDYEGEVSEERGHVSRFAAGTFQLLTNSQLNTDPLDSMQCELFGDLCCELTIHAKAVDGADGDWLLEFSSNRKTEAQSG